MLFFTSDLHLHHERILQLTNRPFESVDEMDDALVRNINETVGTDDVLWILGDVCMGKEKIQSCERFLDALDCKEVHLIIGNHDARKRREDLLTVGFSSVSDYEEVKLGGKKLGILCHYPLMSWNSMRHGSIMLHGHIHAPASYNVENKANGIRRYDVGVDANDFRPVSADSIKAFFHGVAAASK